MALSMIQQLEHQRDFSDWLRGLRSPITSGVVPNLTKALHGYATAQAAFAEGGQFDAVTAGDYQAINAEMAQQFAALSAVLGTTFEPPSQAMTLVEVAAWLGEIVVQLDAAAPGLFDGISESAEG